MSIPASAFFMSYSREDVSYQKRVATELRQRGIIVWVDTENLIPGSPAWEREIERAIRAAAGIIVLLSPDANNSEWVRREISFAEQNDKRIFPVLIRGDEDDSIPLRLSSHQRVDMRRNFNNGLDELTNALKDHLGTTAVHRIPIQKKTFNFNPATLKKFILPGLLALFGLACLGGLTLVASYVLKSVPTPSQGVTAVLTTPPGVDPTDPILTETAVDVVIEKHEPTGKIVYTCNLEGDEVCIIKPDGTGWQRLTNTSLASSNASLSPDGKSILFVTRQGEKSEIYEMDLNSGRIDQLTELGEYVSTPEISPDNRLIIFTYRSGSNNSQIWIMNRDGSDPRFLYRFAGRDAHDATWSPDGSMILFAFGRGENNQLYVMDNGGHDPKLLNDSIDTRGHSSWSKHNLIALDMGGTFMHDIYVMNADGSNLHQISQAGNNSQGESFSPDGEWIAFTAYTDVANKNQTSCEIYIMRVDGSDQRRLTNNDYCDYQPRWGN